MYKYKNNNTKRNQKRARIRIKLLYWKTETKRRTKDNANRNKLLRSLQLGCYFRSFTSTNNDNDNNNNYNPKLYIPKNDWTPDPSNYKIKEKFDRFCKILNRHKDELPSNKKYNLTSHQQTTIRKLQQWQDIIISLTNKNLTPFIAPRSTYIKRCLNKHLLKTNYYKLLSEEDTRSCLSSQKDRLLAIFFKHQDKLSKAHQHYFKREFQLIEDLPNWIAQFYGTFWANKDFPSIRPRILCCGTFREILSKFIDHSLKQIIQSILPTYIKNAEVLTNQ